MALSDADLLDIAARAARLDERLAAHVNPMTDRDPTCVADRLARWGQSLALTSFGREQAAERLGVDAHAIDALLGAVAWPTERPAPHWVRDLAALLEAVEAEPADFADDATGDREEEPFEHVLRPFVREALRRLAQQAPAALRDQLGPLALRDLADQLLARLCGLWAPTLELEFAIARASGGAVAGGVPALAALANDARGHYRRFVVRLLRGDLSRVLREYAVLGRRTVDMIARWLDSTAELLLRLARDRTRLVDELLPSAAGRVVRIVTKLSDPHDGGRGVLALTFADGGRLIYKPHDLAVDAAFADVIRWLCRRGLPLDIMTPRSLSCGTHGWVEFITHEPCRDRAAVARFYFRAGAQLALFHVLGTMDCHFENLIAHGEHPVLCDPETVMHPRVVATLCAAALPGVPPSPGASRTVLDVGLLPSWAAEKDMPAFDISGLGGGRPETPFFDFAWDHVNTDVMVCRLRRLRVADSCNRPTVDGRDVTLHEQVEPIIDGFRTMAALLVAEKADLLAEDGPLTALARGEGRFVLRLSAFYALLLRRLQEPEQLREGIDASLALEQLSPRRVGAALESRRLAAVIHDEKEALERLDVPRFTVVSMPAELFDATPFESFRETLSALDRGAIEQQVNLIRAALFSADVPPEREIPPTADSTPPAPLAATDAKAEARAIAAALAIHAVADRDGSRSWIALNLGDQAHRIALRSVGIGLYEGTAGVALFLAAMARFGEVEEAADLAVRAMRATIRVVARATPADGKLPADGQPLGLGGVLYAMTRCAVWLDRPEWLDAAVRAVRLITARHIERDDHLDVIDGVAGLIPGLLAIHGATGDRTALARAVDCGRHLLARQLPGMAGGRAWPTHGDTMLTGFAHGASGIACQLARLGEASGDAAFLDGARHAIAYEQSLFCEDVGNWPDLRESANEQPAFTISWCNGATGIALSRAACLRSLADLDLLPHIQAAVATMLRAGVGTFDGLCCGNLGRIDVLTSLAVRLQRPDWLDAARTAAAAALARRHARGAWRPVLHIPRDVFHPSLFHGAAGIGYALLRLAMPDRVPSVLWME